MMRQALLLAIALVSGCAAPAPDPSEAPPQRVDEPPVPASALREDTGIPAPRNVSIPLAAQGNTEGEACPGGLGQEHCVIAAPAEGSPILLPPVDRPTLLELSIEISEPVHAPGCGWAVLRVREGEAWRSLGGEGMVAFGSPMAITWSLADQPASAEFHLAIYCGSDTHVGEGVVTLYRGWSVPFRVEGRLHHEV